MSSRDLKDSRKVRLVKRIVDLLDKRDERLGHARYMRDIMKKHPSYTPKDFVLRGPAPTICEVVGQARAAHRKYIRTLRQLHA